MSIKSNGVQAVIDRNPSRGQLSKMQLSVEQLGRNSSLDQPGMKKQYFDQNDKPNPLITSTNSDEYMKNSITVKRRDPNLS